MAAALQWCRLSLPGCPRHVKPPWATQHPERVWPWGWVDQPKGRGGNPELPETVSFRDVPLAILQEKLPLEGEFGPQPQVGLGRPPPLSSMRSALRAKRVHLHRSVSLSQLYSRLFEFRLQTKWNSSSRQAGCTAHKSGNHAALSAGVAWPGGACAPGASCESQSRGQAKGGGGNTQSEAMKGQFGSKC